ncbi:MAG: hypothetical protein ACI8RZ_002406 [Myxococcota bacterium]|jgi:hypothetical protein
MEKQRRPRPNSRRKRAPTMQHPPHAEMSNSERIAEMNALNANMHGKNEEETESEYDTQSEAWRLGYDDGVMQAEGGMENIQSDPVTQSALSDAAQASGVSQDDLTAMAIIESTGNRDVGTNRSGFTGLMQMGRRASQDVDMPFEDLKGADNVDNNALAGARYWNLNDQWLNEEIPRDPLHMYLAHQQGAGGTNSLMSTLAEDPNTTASRNQRNNLPGRVVQTLGNVTAQDFYDYWSGKMTAIQDAVHGEEVNGKRN